MIYSLLAQIELNVQEAANNAGVPGADAADPEVAFGELIGGMLSMVLYLAALLSFLYLIWGAYQWITSGGDSGKLQSARNRIIQAILGLIVLASVLAIFSIVQSFLGVCFIKFAGMSCPDDRSAKDKGKPTAPKRTTMFIEGENTQYSYQRHYNS